jgi:hypothetical protein
VDFYMALERGTMQLHTLFLHLADEDTQPLSIVAPQSFRLYMERNALTIRDVAHASHVRLLVVWNILHGNPVLPRDASKVRGGLFFLTGERYRSFIRVRSYHSGVSTAHGNSRAQSSSMYA